MIYTALTKKALSLCFEAHKDQVDKSGLPYVFHPFHLAMEMTDELSTVVALLHDVIEDTDYTLQDLEKMGFPPAVLEAISLMTHREGVPYMEYVATIKTNPLARIVKMADLRHNSNIARVDNPTEKDYARVEKYRRAMALLEQAE